MLPKNFSAYSNENDTEVQEGNTGWAFCYLGNHGNCDSVTHLLLGCDAQGGFCLFFQNWIVS